MKGGVSSEDEPPTKKQKKVKTQNEVNNIEERNRPLMDQKTIDDMVKALVEERLKVLGKILENYDNLSNGGEEDLCHHRSRIRNRTTDLDFVYVSHLKATKDDKDAKVSAYGRGCKGMRTVKDEDTADKKKAVQAEAALKRKEKADAKRKEAALKKQKLVELKNQEAEAKRKEAELKKQKLAELKKQKHAELKKQKHAGEDNECALTNDEFLAEENEFAPESDVENQEVIRSAVGIPPKPPAPADKPAVLSADHESDFYSILIHERPWFEKEYRWVFDNMRHLKSTWANGGDKPPWMLTRVWHDLVHKFKEFGPDNFGFRQ
ncbi:hypothetical protein Bca52824_060267 [Brassica carinata]|uniref:Uncharacterized protein n=1 Tax=Brassica carinata TaxID=52824 RepID=A0A8X7UGC6_BRACI|nr:hypothetical protein Bca52824_060267 [Brassica carinata]